MRVYRVTIVAASWCLLFGTIVIVAPRPTQGQSVQTESNDDHEYRDWWRSLQTEEDACSNACDTDDISHLRESVAMDARGPEEQQQQGRGNGLLGRIFGRFAGVLDDNESVFGRWMNGLFKLFNQSNKDDPKYMIPTVKIIPLLSNYSTKIKSLSSMIREKSFVHDTGGYSNDVQYIHYEYGIIGHLVRSDCG